MFKQQKVILGIIIVFLFYGIASAGMLSGRIVKRMANLYQNRDFLKERIVGK